jgi:hypothetical protein
MMSAYGIGCLQEVTFTLAPLSGINIAQPDVTLMLDLQGVILDVSLSNAVSDEAVDDWRGVAALDLANGNRTAAAEILGMSRQGSSRRRPSGRRICRTANANRSISPVRSTRTARFSWCGSRIAISSRPAPARLCAGCATKPRASVARTAVMLGYLVWHASRGDKDARSCVRLT